MDVDKANSTANLEDEVWGLQRAFSKYNEGGWRTNETTKKMLIWVDFEKPVTPRKVAFRPRQTDIEAAKIETPKKFKFYGSNDTTCHLKSQWTKLCEKEHSDRVENFNEKRSKFSLDYFIICDTIPFDVKQRIRIFNVFV